LVIAVHDLERAGLDIHRLRTVTLSAASTPGTNVEVSTLFHLKRGGEFIADDEPRARRRQAVRHSSGLDSLLTVPAGRRAREVYHSHALGAVTEFNELPVVATRPRASQIEYPHSVIVDYSDTDSPRPL